VKEPSEFDKRLAENGFGRLQSVR